MAHRHPISPELLMEHAGFVRAAARAAIGRDDQVEDAVQDTFAIALTKGPRQAGSVRSWLGTVARNRALDLVRMRARGRERAQRAARPERVASTLDVAERAEMGRLLIRTVMALPDPYREAILLRYYDGLSPKQIGHALGLPTETARTRVRRGLERLRKALDERHGGDGRRWAVLMAPLMNGPAPALAGSGATLLGMMIMKKMALGLVVLFAAIAVWQVGLKRDGAGDDASIESVPLADATSETGLSGRAPLQTAREGQAAQTSVLEGIVRRGGRTIAARVEVRRIGGSKSPQAQSWAFDARHAVELADSQAPALRRLQTDEDGAFRAEGLAPGRYELRGIATDGAWGFTTAEVVAGRGTRQAKIRIHGGSHMLHGRCLHQDGRPFLGTVLLQDFGYGALRFGHCQALACVQSAADGRFTIKGVAPGEYFLTAVARGRSRSVLRIALPARDELVFVVDPGQRSISGRVIAREGGRPISGASIVSSHGTDGLAYRDRATTTDAEGRFQLSGGRGQAQLRVSAPRQEGQTVRLAKGGDVELTITLEGRGSIRGLVRDAEGGQPLADVPVYAVGLTEAGWAKNEIFRVVSGEDGRFELDATAVGDVAVFALGDGWASAGLANWKVPGANPLALRVSVGEPTQVTLDVTRAPTLSGVCLDPAGAPCEGALITAEMEHVGSNVMESMPLRFLWSRSPLGANREIRTGPEGRFSYTALVPDAAYRLLAQHPGHGPTQAGPFQVAAGAVKTITLQLRQSRFAELGVRDRATGAPVVGAVTTLWLRVGDRGMRSTAYRFATDDDGNARMALPDGRYVLSLRAPGYLPLSYQEGERFEIGPGPDVRVEASMQRGARISGRVSAPGAVRVEGARVIALPKASTRKRGARPAHLGFYEARCGQDGSFVFDALPPGEYDLRVSRQTREILLLAQAVVQAGDEGVSLRLAETPRDAARDGLLVRIQTPDGTPVSQGNLILFGSNGIYGVSFAEYPIVVKFGPGSHGLRLVVYGAQDATGAILPVGAVFLGPFEAAVGTLEVTLPPEEVIRGRATRPDGSGVAGVEIRAFLVHPDLPEEVGLGDDSHAVARTAADGSFALRQLGDFQYELRATVPAALAPLLPMRVQAGSNNVRLLVRKALEGSLLLQDWSGKPVQGAQLRFRVDPGSTAAKAREGATNSPWRWRDSVSLWWNERIRPPLRSDAEGRVALAGFDHDSEYELYIEPPSERPDLKPIVRFGWRPNERDEFVFERAWLIHGVVVDLEGAPVVNAHVQRRGKDRRWRGVQTDKDGRFRFERLSVPEVEVRVYLGTRPPQDPQIHRLQATQEPLTLRLDAGAALRVRVAGWTSACGQVPAYLSRADGSRPQEHLMRVDEEGRLYFQGLDRELTYVLFIAAPSCPGEHVYETGLRAGEAEITFKLRDSKAVRGRVRFLGETQPDEIRIETRRGDVTASAVAAQDGTFVLSGLPEGSYTVRASAFRQPTQEGQTRPRPELLGQGAADLRTGTAGIIEISPRAPR